MKLTYRLQAKSPDLSDRLKAALSEFGAASSMARATGLTPQKVTNYANGHVVSIPLETVLKLEQYLATDLLGDSRAAIAAQLRDLADQVCRQHQQPPDQG